MERMHPDTPVGFAEIADMFAVPVRTVYTWLRRNELPPADLTVHGKPTWKAGTIAVWAASRRASAAVLQVEVTASRTPAKAG